MIFVLTGPVHSGKTSFLKRLVDELKEKNLKIDGFLSGVVLKDQEQEILGYDLFDIKEESCLPFIRKEGEEAWERVGSYFFIPEALNHAKALILQSQEGDVLVVDEVGPLEMAGKGLWPAIEKALSSPPKVIIFVVRERILKDFLALVSRKEIEMFDIREKDAFSRMREALLKV